MNKMKYILCELLSTQEQTGSLEYREYRNTFICIALFEFPDSENKRQQFKKNYI